MPFYAKITDGQLDFSSPAAASKFQEWKRGHEGAKIVIDDDKPTRSCSKNSYYHMYLEVIAKETGETASDLHEWAKRKFLPPRFVTIRGQEMKLPSSTTDLDKATFTDYLDKISAEIGAPLPNHEDAGYISNYDPIIKR
jgi:hypothetical protein